MGGFWILRADAAWQGPTLNPPLGNVSAPINVSNVDQFKEGGLTIGGAVFGDAFTVKAPGDLAININKFTVTALTGDTSIAGTLTVTGDASFGSAGLKILTVNDTLLVKDSTDTKELFKVDGAPSGQDEVRVGDDATTSGMFQARSIKDNVPAITATKPNNIAGPTIVVQNSYASNASLYAKNDLGSGIYAISEAATYGAIVGKSTVGSSGLTALENYSAGVRGESALTTQSGIQAISGVLGLGSDLTNYANNEVRTFGVVGAGGDINNPAGNSPRLTTGVYGKAGNITSSIPQAVTYGVFGEKGLVTGSGTSWAGYFDGNVKVTETISSEKFSGSITKSTTGAVGTFSYNDGVIPSTLVEIGAENPEDIDQKRFGIRMDSPLALIPNQSAFPNKQLVFDASSGGYDTYFTYYTPEQCLELWMPVSAVEPTKQSPAGSWIAQEWGDSCSGPCQGDCYRVGGPGGSCPSGKVVKPGKCAQQEGLNSYIKCCGVGPS